MHEDLERRRRQRRRSRGAAAAVEYKKRGGGGHGGGSLRLGVAAATQSPPVDGHEVDACAVACGVEFPLKGVVGVVQGCSNDADAGRLALLLPGPTVELTQGERSYQEDLAAERW